MAWRGPRRKFALPAPDPGHQAAAGKMDRFERIEACASQPALHLVVGEAEMDVGVLALEFDHGLKVRQESFPVVPGSCRLPHQFAFR